MDFIPKEILEELEKLAQMPDGDEAIAFFAEIKEKLAPHVEERVAYFELIMHEQVFNHELDDRLFLANLHDKWGNAFVAYKAMYSLAIVFAANYCESVGDLSKSPKNYTFNALNHIFGRACQQFDEILCLMENGYSDGAYARWRSLYELAVYANFIFKNGETVAKAYSEQADTDEWKPLWAKAANCMKNEKNISFDKIAEKCNMSYDAWKKEYSIASKLVHASAQGTYKRLGVKEPSQHIMVGKSDWGHHVPAERAAISLMQISNLFFNTVFNIDGYVSSLILRGWVEVIRKHFHGVVNTCFPEGAELILYTNDDMQG